VLLAAEFIHDYRASCGCTVIPCHCTMQFDIPEDKIVQFAYLTTYRYDNIPETYSRNIFSYNGVCLGDCDESVSCSNEMMTCNSNEDVSVAVSATGSLKVHAYASEAFCERYSNEFASFFSARLDVSFASPKTTGTGTSTHSITPTSMPTPTAKRFEKTSEFIKFFC
jgi:hypothetical protein